MSDALFEKLNKIEPAVAAAYKAVVKNNVVDLRGLAKIVGAVIDDKGPAGSDIDRAEAEALVLILDSGEVSEAAKKQMLAELKKPANLGRIVNGSSVILKKDDPELAAFHAVFAIKYTGNIKFYSKGTNLTYAPLHYQAIAQLVKNGKIQVVKVMDSGLMAKAEVDAVYVAPNNAFIFNQHKGEASFFAHAPTIVHEATHAVQDWFDVTSPVTVRFTEADAYIAQAVVDPNMVAPQQLKDAAKFVTDGTATKGNKDWYKAYDAWAALIGTHPLYKDRADDPAIMVADGEDELKEMTRVLDALSKPAQPAGKSKTAP